MKAVYDEEITGIEVNPLDFNLFERNNIDS